MKKKHSLILAAVLAVSVLAGCASQGGAPAGKEADTSVAAADAGGSQAAADTAPSKTELTIAIAKDINSLDPHNTGNTLTSAVQSNMYEWLVNRDQDGNIIPGLADSWKQEDEVTWSFHLREGIKFHSGNELTAEDVRFSYLRVQEDWSAQRANYSKIQDVEIVDNYNLKIITDGPDPILLNRISRLGSGIMDSKLFNELGEDEYIRQISGTGPYKLDHWTKDEEIVMVRNDEYWGDKAVWDKVTFRVVTEESTRTAELLTGGVDIALDCSPSEIDRINENEGTSVVGFPTNRVIYWVVNTTSEGLDDKRVRQAIDYAIDDQTLLDAIYGGSGTITETIVAPGMTGSDPSLIGVYKYDLEKAKSLLGEYTDETGKTVSFELASGNGQYLKDKELTELVAYMLGEAGFEVELNVMDTSRFTEIKNAFGFTGLRMNGYSSSMGDGNQDLNFLAQEKPVQFTGFHNEELDSLYKTNTSLMDMDQRVENIIRMQAIVEDEEPVIPMLMLPGYYGISDSVDYTPRADEYIYVDEIHAR